VQVSRSAIYGPEMSTQQLQIGPRHLASIYLQLPLFIASALEIWDVSSSLPVLFADHAEVPEPGPGGAVITAAILLWALCAVAGLVLAAVGSVRAAITALACVGICTWFKYLPSVVEHGFDFRLNGAGIQVFLDTEMVLPIVIAAIWLAVRTNRLGWATLLACLPTTIKMIGLVIFIAAVLIYGF